MKKWCLIFILVVCMAFMLVGCTSVAAKDGVGKEESACRLLEAAKKDDIKTFAALVESGANLDEVNEKGLTVQLGLAYFSDENFEKACSVLNARNFDFDRQNEMGVTLLYTLAYSLQTEKIETLLKYDVDVNKRVDDLLPIQATQFSTYRFHTGQTIDPRNAIKAEQIQNLLAAHGSESFTYIEPSFYYCGNFLFSLVNAISVLNDKVTPTWVNSVADWEYEQTEDRLIAAIRYESLPDLFDSFGITAEVSLYTEKADFPAVLKKSVEDPDNPYFIFCFTGDSKIAPYQWLIINNVHNTKSSYRQDDYCEGINPYSVFDYADYQISDFSEIILAKITL